MKAEKHITKLNRLTIFFHQRKHVETKKCRTPRSTNVETIKLNMRSTLQEVILTRNVTVSGTNNYCSLFIGNENGKVSFSIYIYFNL